MAGLSPADVLAGAAVVLLVAVLALLRRMRANLAGPVLELRAALEAERRRAAAAPPPPVALGVSPDPDTTALSRRLAVVEALAGAMARELAGAQGDADALRATAVRNAGRAAHLGRIAAGGRLREQRTTLALIWPQVLERLGSRVSSEHTLRVAIPADLPPAGGSGESWVEILAELVANAVEACPGGGIIGVRAAPERSGWLRVVVEDGGRGIAPEALPHVFEPFYTSRAHAGGLGLALAGSLIEGLGGTISIASKLGEGTRVTLDVPAARSSRALVRFDGQVLVADDDAEVRRALAGLLESLGLGAVECDSGTLARVLLAADPGRFRAAILDVVMPGAPVDDVVRAVRERAPAFPILLVSGYDTMPMVDGVLGLGGVRFLRKPFTREELFHALQDLFSASA